MTAGSTFPSLFAMIARRHMHEFGTRREHLAAVAVKNHANGALNPDAHLRKVITLDQAMAGKPVADPLTEYRKDLEAHRNSSVAHFRIGEILIQQGDYQAAANELREALSGDMQPRWIEVWALINLGKIFDITHQRDRALNEYRQALGTKDNTRGALDEAKKYTETPYSRN